MAAKKSFVLFGSRFVPAMAALLPVLTGGAHGRQLTARDYARAEQFMPYDAAPLVDHDVQHVHWLDERRFWYIDHDSGGDHYLVMAVTGVHAQAIFDAPKLAAALGKA